ncbi:MAG: peptidylprolyl isomerase, partial [Betaproteobacteria bacterium]|nr:peptidylprolyl isomerase [Betaproteobacteria bacterium]
MTTTFVRRWLLCCALGTTTAWAQLPAGALATVNGVALSQATFDKVVQVNLAQGQTDSPQLRQAIKTELIARELLLQESKRRGLDKPEAAQEAWAALQQNFLIDLLVNDHLTQNPITEAHLQAEYERQTALLKGAEQYQLRHIVLPTEKAAKDVLAG